MQNIYKYLISTYLMPKRVLDNNHLRPKAKTITVKGTVTTDQREILQKLVGIIGSNEQDVVGKILTLWLYNEGFLKPKKGGDKN